MNKILITLATALLASSTFAKTLDYSVMQARAKTLEREVVSLIDQQDMSYPATCYYALSDIEDDLSGIANAFRYAIASPTLDEKTVLLILNRDEPTFDAFITTWLKDDINYLNSEMGDVKPETCVNPEGVAAAMQKVNALKIDIEQSL